MSKVDNYISNTFTDCFDLTKDEEVFVEMSDMTHKFVVGLSDLLQILHFAEEQREVPKLPTKWWKEVLSKY